jgi:hypothetical protein
MEVSKVPPADVPATRVGTATTTEQGSQSAAAVAPMADHADIRPLDVPMALQILLAEVRAGLDLPLDGPATQGATVQNPIQAAHELVDMFLQELPEEATDAQAWTAALAQVETAMQLGIERAIDIVAVWREVPPVVVDAVKETGTLFFSALSTELENPIWLRPEWMGLAPSLQRFWRRRRNARRRFTDPDYPPTSLDDSEEFRR